MRRATAVGAFVLGAIAIAVIAVLVFAGRGLLVPKLRAVAYFQNSVAGLTVGAPVTLRGVKIGAVASMKIFLKLPDLTPVIPVFMDIDPRQVSWTGGPVSAVASDITSAVKNGLRAQLATQSLVTGQVSVNLDFFPGTPASVVGHDNDLGPPEIPTIPSDFEHIKNELADLNLPQLSAEARTALAGLNTILGQLNGKLGPLVDSVKQTSDDARTTLDTTTDAVRQLRDNASQTLDAVRQLTDAARGKIDKDGTDIDQAVNNLNRVVTQAGKVMDNLHDITTERSPTRDNLAAAVRDLAASASSLRNFSREVEQNPSSLLLGRR